MRTVKEDEIVTMQVDKIGRSSFKINDEEVEIPWDAEITPLTSSSRISNMRSVTRLKNGLSIISDLPGVKEQYRGLRIRIDKLPQRP